MNHFYYVVGHSYMSVDRLLSRIEKELRIKDTLLTISEYNKVINHHSGVIKLDEGFNMLESNNDVNLVREKYKSFKISKYKRFRFDNGRVGVSFDYEGYLGWIDYQDILINKEFEYKS